MSNKFPSRKNQYGYGCKNYINTTWDNFCTYLTFFKTYGPSSSIPSTERSMDALAAGEACDWICTCCFLPCKCVVLVPACPFPVFCPTWCSCYLDINEGERGEM